MFCMSVQFQVTKQGTTVSDPTVSASSQFCKEINGAARNITQLLIVFVVFILHLNFWSFLCSILDEFLSCLIFPFEYQIGQIVCHVNLISTVYNMILLFDC